MNRSLCAECWARECMLFMALLAWREGAPTFLRVRPRYTSLLCKFCARWRVCIILACDREQHQPNVHRDMPDGEILPLLCGVPIHSSYSVAIASFG
jgi:hypothetical protein